MAIKKIVIRGRTQIHRLCFLSNERLSRLKTLLEMQYLKNINITIIDSFPFVAKIGFLDVFFAKFLKKLANETDFVNFSYWSIFSKKKLRKINLIKYVLSFSI